MILLPSLDEVNNYERTNIPLLIVVGLYQTLHEMYESIKTFWKAKLMDPEKEGDEKD